MAESPEFRSALRPDDNGKTKETMDGLERPRPKRFYKHVSVERDEAGFAIRLDGRPVKTPQRNALTLPSGSLAKLIAEEWEAQTDFIVPERMLQTKFANTALDRVAGRTDDIVQEMVSYLATDALLYRAERPDKLVAQQVKAWDPLLQWMSERHDIELSPVTGVMYAAQSEASLAQAAQLLAEHDIFTLTGMHNLMTLSGSTVLAMATEAGEVTPDEAWQIAHVDEDFQIAEWGEDAEAMARRALRKQEFDAAFTLIEAVRDRHQS